ncbi:hypothetical protein [Nocardioides iriomotensis]|uniref:Uncharacterized protein n=1 Tax=Nocardioides iriomotensis TaxID=715784 RepID=A0A4Q5J7X6_9ACTN|nr:hypothetical protein [Nocardioides iriomotensis]RYU14812.1 hypothetical protein ETU37_02145 [Nocardioides iriomotensis]
MTELDPTDFSELLNRSFGAEPPPADPAADLRRGRRRLLRHRTSTSLTAVAAIAVIAGGTTMLPTLGVNRTVGPAADGESVTRPVSAEETVATCLRKENVLHVEGDDYMTEAASLRLMGREPRLMSSSSDADRTVATLLSADGKYWGSCQFRNQPHANVKNMMNVFSTKVAFPTATVAGVEAYQPDSASDPRLVATADPPVPQLEVDCPASEPEETPARYAEHAACPEFTMYWNDRRPANVAAVRIIAPDGVSSWADVTHGYLSWTYRSKMTPEVAADLAHGEVPGAQRVVFYDRLGKVLVDDRYPGQLPQDGDLSIANFPSLAWWLKD